jgi:hypothetical protein
VSTGNWVKHIVRPSNWNIGDWRRCNSSPIPPLTRNPLISWVLFPSSLNLWLPPLTTIFKPFEFSQKTISWVHNAWEILHHETLQGDGAL